MNLRFYFNLKKCGVSVIRFALQNTVQVDTRFYPDIDDILHWIVMKCYIYFLKAYRQVFEHLIEDFKTYKPLLSSIKNEYEMMLSAQREEIRRLEPLRVNKWFLVMYSNSPF